MGRTPGVVAEQRRLQEAEAARRARYAQRAPMLAMVLMAAMQRQRRAQERLDALLTPEVRAALLVAQEATEEFLRVSSEFALHVWHLPPEDTERLLAAARELAGES